MFEPLVRPWQSSAAVATRRIVSVRAQVATETAGGTWGVAGTLPTAVEVPVGEDPQSIAIEVKKTKRQDAVQRDIERVKVTNPDDPDQFVVVERIKRIRFKEKDADSVAAFPKTSSATATQTTAGASPPGTWQPGETQVQTDGTGALQKGEERSTYPLKIEERDFYINWPPGPNETPA
jgi:hypothetical protein